MIRGLWDCHAEVIIEVKLGDADADSYIFEPIAGLLDWCKKTKKNKHGIHCHNQQKHFYTFVIYVDGMVGK